MADWNPALYSRFEDERTRPAADLLARVPLEQPRLAFDLGCGPGNSTALIAARYPEAEIVGLDTSAAMLDAARVRLPRLQFAQADAATWEPIEAPDLIYANAVLQWLPDHSRLLPRLFGLLGPGGVLAVQMPDNLAEPSHRLMREVAAAGPWAAAIGDPAVAGRLGRMLEPTGYYDLLAPLAEEVDVWRTAYHHRMADAAAIVAWVSATGLRPFLDPLDVGQSAGFLAAYEAKIEAAYPPRTDGQRLLAFPRVFIVARKSS
ncbi:trans-aconitate 2-methyltransferase [Methylobacterium persicinum]|uniref:Trans-aconitate 2-methyltransferase n=1 Tax=Methylobacterium persicinum TaxID=374426 RepID=A0ABU0HH14_9HYPH|nr:trans-aconitate 2-methyltransferase [Methylobacterium persicinum]MDQ0441606.1 trans-aconitate 2-methyltransferase [Methylobacterium persicinum]GJE39368.1 Trans-aconitate 2-methyltransferase [Methylobacterium persicinum]